MALVALGLVVLGLVLLMVYVRWFAGQVGADLPRVEVQTLPDSAKGATRVRLCLRATARQFRLVRLYAEREDVVRLGISAPEGFVPEEDPEGAETIECWVPARPLKLKPQQPIELEFRYDASDEAAVTVHGWAEAGLGLGGTIVSISIVVGERDRLEVELSNLRSRLYTQAAEQGVVPRELPEFDEVRKLAADLERSRSDPNRRRSGSPGAPNE